MYETKTRDYEREWEDITKNQIEIPEIEKLSQNKNVLSGMNSRGATLFRKKFSEL